MISAVFRRGGDVSFVVEELKVALTHVVGPGFREYIPSILRQLGACWNSI